MFTNYAFDFTVFHTKNQKELFNLDWINERRTGGIQIDITLKKHSPHGEFGLGLVRKS